MQIITKEIIPSLSQLLCAALLCISLSINAITTATITPVPGSPFNLSGGNYVYDVAYSSDLKWFACPNYTEFTVSVFSVASNGSLTPVSGSPFPLAYNTIIGANAIAYSPDNRFLVVGSYPIGLLELFSVDQTTGALTPLITSIFAGTVNINGVIYSPNGNFLAIAAGDMATLPSYVDMFTVNTGTGALTPVSPVSVFPTNHIIDFNTTSQIAFSPDSRFLAQANYDNNSITIFTVDQSTGALGPFDGYFYGTDYTVPGVTGMLSTIAYSPNGKFLAVADGDIPSSSTNHLAIFTVDPSTGIPTWQSTISLAPRSGQQVVAFSPDSQFLALANDDMNNANNELIFVYSVDETGNLTQINAVPIATSGPSFVATMAFSPNNNGTYFVSTGGYTLDPNVTSYAFQTSSSASGPTNVTGTIINNVFLDKTERIIAITWTASGDATVVSYNIYNGATLIGKVSASNSLVFNALLANGANIQNFSVTAVSSNGMQSAPVPVTIV